MEELIQIQPTPITLEELDELLTAGKTLGLAEETKEKIRNCHRFLQKKLAEGGTYYGINTGFGSLCNVRINDDQLKQLQENLVRSHACGTGPEVPLSIVKRMLLLKVLGLSKGHSGVSLQLVERLVAFCNEDLLPVVYQQGSLGASGDLAPLAHLSLALIAEGEVYLKGERMTASEAHRILGWQPLELGPKEGLALLNGTQFCTAYGTWLLSKGRHLLHIANLCAALSMDAFDCLPSPLDRLLHEVRPHPGQKAVAESIRYFLNGSEILTKKKEYVQDPYAFRCVPQVHGASADVLSQAEQVILREINSVTDNPTLFPEEDLILSGGNFHAQPLALALDHLAMALAELGSISERRTYQLISGQRGLPPFLTPQSGLNSGLMIPQYTAASIVSENKQLCTPASVDSIVSSNGQEDHVSMGANAATKAYRVACNLETILAIEFMTAAQAIEFRRPLKSSPYLENLLKSYRCQVAPLNQDRILHHDIQKTIAFLRG